MTSKSRQLRLKESLKSGVRVRLDLADIAGGVNPDHVYVAISNVGEPCGDCSLRVCSAIAETAAVGSDKMPLLEVPIPRHTCIAALTCYITEGRTLYIRERAKESMCVEFGGGHHGDVFLPVVREDESQLRVTVTMHVPEPFNFEDLTVKTVDDRLVVRGRQMTGGCELSSGVGGGEEGEDKPLTDSFACGQ
jgi:hypothetical protein